MTLMAPFKYVNRLKYIPMALLKPKITPASFSESSLVDASRAGEILLSDVVIVEFVASVSRFLWRMIVYV